MLFENIHRLHEWLSPNPDAWFGLSASEICKNSSTSFRDSSLEALSFRFFYYYYYCIEPICAAVTNVYNYNCTGSIHLSGLLNNPFEIQHTF